jgi:hypothetical protein
VTSNPFPFRVPNISAVLIFISTGCAEAADSAHFIFEAYPSDVLASKQVYQRHLAATGMAITNVPYYLIVPKLQRWVPGQVVRVAFSGGNEVLHQKIAAVANKWVIDAGINLRLSFTDVAGNYRTWTSDDAVYAAEIRIAFFTDARGGNWSHVGTDSMNANLVGGVPGQASMNLGGLDRELPNGWEATVLHEFGHALGFEHEHQSPAGGCDFRFDDDPGYIPSTDAQGWYSPDHEGRRPGLYTYLGGYANRWPREKVDANLKVLPVSSAFLTGSFDKHSIMNYHFPAFFFRAGEQSHCYTRMDNHQLSRGDVDGARRAYPSEPGIASTQITERRTALRQLRDSQGTSAGIKAHAQRQLKAMGF